MKTALFPARPRPARFAVPASALALLAAFAAPARSGLVEELDWLRRPGRLAEFRTGTIVAQESSYDRTGGNDDGFSGKHSFIGKEGDKLILADLKGPGVIHRIWTPTPTDKNLEFYFDGEAEPRLRIKFSDLFTGGVFPFVEPFCGHEAGGYYAYIPIPYEKSCRILYDGDRIQFHQIQYRTLAPGETTATWPKEWSAEERAALEAAVKAWTSDRAIAALDVAQSSRHNKGTRPFFGTHKLEPGKPVTIFEAKAGGRIHGFNLSPPEALAAGGRNLLVRAWWDGAAAPAINCPAADFFGRAFLDQPVRSLLAGERGEAYFHMPMPFDSSARVELVYYDVPPEGRYAPVPPISVSGWAGDDPRGPNEGRFYAHWRRERPGAGVPYTVLDVKGRGHFAGWSLQAQGLNPGMTLFFEGDDVFTIDGELRIHGTGSEDAFNGGWYALPDRWDGPVNLPSHGCSAYSIPFARTAAYRFNIADKVSFEKSLKLTIEHGGENNSVPVDYSSVAYYYSADPPASNPAPLMQQRDYPAPPYMEFWLQLLPVAAFSHGGKLDYGGWRDPASQEYFESLTFTPPGQNGFMKVEIETLGEGDYDLFVDHLTGPGYGRFRVNRRQEPLGEIHDAFAEAPGIARDVRIGTVRLPRGKSGLTFWTEGKNEKAAGADFALHRIRLKPPARR